MAPNRNSKYIHNMGKTTAPKSTSEHTLQQGKTTPLICETTKNVNGPSQSVVDAIVQLSAHYVHPKQKNTYAWVNNPTQQGKITDNGGPA